MAGVSAASSLGASGSTSPTTGNDLRSVDLNQFLDLMIAELQNQDPLNPMDNAELIQQISQIREIGATNQLSETLTSMQLGQNLSTASSLIGKRVNALADDGTDVQGIVDRVSVEVSGDKRSLLGHIGDRSFDLANVREVEGG